MINQANQISGLANHHLCPMKCHLNCGQIGEVLKFLTDSASETTHAIHLIDHLNATKLLLKGGTIYFDMNYMRMKRSPRFISL